MRRAHEGAASAVARPAAGEAALDPVGTAPAAVAAAESVGGDPATPRPPPPTAGYVRPKYFTWASLLERTFATDILACPDCGGRLRLISTITDSSVIEKILRHLGLPTETALPIPAKVAGWLPGVEPAADWITQ